MKKPKIGTYGQSGTIDQQDDIAHINAVLEPVVLQLPVPEDNEYRRITCLFMTGQGATIVPEVMIGNSPEPETILLPREGTSVVLEYVASSYYIVGGHNYVVQ